MNLKSFFSKIFLPQDKKNQILISIFIVIVFASFMIMYFGFWKSSSVLIDSDAFRAPGETNKDIRIEKIIEKIDFDVSFLKTSHFQDLNTYGEWPLEIGEKGRQNPFLSY